MKVEERNNEADEFISSLTQEDIEAIYRAIEKPFTPNEAFKKALKEYYESRRNP